MHTNIIKQASDYQSESQELKKNHVYVVNFTRANMASDGARVEQNHIVDDFFHEKAHC